jgi:hypothetical protein
MSENQPSCCKKSSSEIKNWVAQKLDLSGKETVLVSVCGVNLQTAQTLVMVIEENGNESNLRFCKIQKVPQQVSETDIPKDMKASCCMELTSIHYKGEKLVFA